MPLFFFFNDAATTEIYTLSLHDALPICGDRRRPRLAAAGGAAELRRRLRRPGRDRRAAGRQRARPGPGARGLRSEEHTSELQSRQYLVCRLLLEKKKHDRTPVTPISRMT